MKTASLLMALALGQAQQAYALPQGSYGSHEDGIAADDFVQTSGLRLHSKNGTFYSVGINYWACMNLAADESEGGNHSRFITELDQMADKGINHLRIMAASEGNPTPQPFRMRPALQQSPGEYNEKIFVGLDRCLAEMSKRGMRATMTLNNQWQWSGGFAQYVSWANDNEIIDYPSSWNLSKPPQRSEPRTGWGNYTDENDPQYTDYTTWINYSNMMYNTSQAETWYKDHIRTVLNRKNTINGRVYKEDATVLSWQLANEPQPANPDDYLGAYGLTYPANPDDPLLPWIKRISTYIKSLAPNQLCSVGLESKQGEWYFKAVHDMPTVDYATSHCWVQNWGIYDMYNASLSNLQAANDFAREFIGNTSRWAEDISKPILLEEFGMARNNWENEEKEYPYLSSASRSFQGIPTSSYDSMLISSSRHIEQRRLLRYHHPASHAVFPV